MKQSKELAAIGWREWVSLPELRIPWIKAKVDTGARSSALHAFDIELFTRGRVRMVRFKVHPRQRDAHRTIAVEARLHDERLVRNSGGKQTLRPVIETSLEIQGRSWPIELTLVGRDAMGFRMLLGRQAVRGRFLVDPGRSYLNGRPARKKRTGRAKRKASAARPRGRDESDGS